MAISGIGTYIPTIDQFINHWTQVNTALGVGNALELQDGYMVSDLSSDRGTLLTSIDAVVIADNARTDAAADRDIKKAALHPRVGQFRSFVQGLLPDSIYVRSLPRVPPLDTSEGSFLKAMVDVQNLWTRINAMPPIGFAPPLKLSGGYLIANLNTDLTALRTAYTTATNTTQDAGTARSTRDTTFSPIYERLVQYRKAVPAVLPPNSPLLATIPALTPPRGSTPDPVSASGAWNAALVKAEITHTQSDNPALDRYELRYSPSNPYKTTDEQVVASHGAGQTVFVTDVGLAAPGSAANYRVYVVLTTGNEKGSATVRVTRPAP